MKFTIRNKAKIANKYIRFSKWKIRKFAKFTKLLYAEIYVNRESHKSEYYKVTVKLGVPGPDIIVSAQASNLNSLWSELTTKLKREIRKNNEKRVSLVRVKSNYS